MTPRRATSSVPVNPTIDNCLYHLLVPLCDDLAFACVDAAWEAIVGVLDEHAQREASLITKRAARRASKKDNA